MSIFKRAIVWIDGDPITGDNDVLDRLVDGLKAHPIRNGIALLVIAAITLKVILWFMTFAAISDQIATGH